MAPPAYRFTPEDGRKGALARNAKHAAAVREQRRKAEIVWRVVGEVDDLAPAALERTLSIIEQIDPTELPVENWLDAKRAIEVAETSHRISRLARGQSTANVAHAAMTDEERRERMALLRGIVGETVLGTPD